MIVGLLADIVDCLFIVASNRLYAHCGSDLLYFRINIAKATEKHPFGLCRELTEVTRLTIKKYIKKHIKNTSKIQNNG